MDISMPKFFFFQIHVVCRRQVFLYFIDEDMKIKYRKEIKIKFFSFFALLFLCVNQRNNDNNNTLSVRCIYMVHVTSNPFFLYMFITSIRNFYIAKTSALYSFDMENIYFQRIYNNNNNNNMRKIQ